MRFVCQGLKIAAVATRFPGALETWALAGTDDSTSALALSSSADSLLASASASVSRFLTFGSAKACSAARRFPREAGSANVYVLVDPSTSFKSTMLKQLVAQYRARS